MAKALFSAQLAALILAAGCVEPITSSPTRFRAPSVYTPSRASGSTPATSDENQTARAGSDPDPTCRTKAAWTKGAPADASDEPSPEGGPSQKETLDWIAQRFSSPTEVTYTFEGSMAGGGTFSGSVEYETTLLSIEKCQITYRSVRTTRTMSRDEIGRPEDKDESSVCLLGIVALGNLDPTSFHAVNLAEQDPYISIRRGHVVRAAWGVNGMIAGPELAADSEELARRMSRALTAAAIACGGKAQAF